jgi:hypothetical protein
MRRFLSLLIFLAAIGVCVTDGTSAPTTVGADPNRDYPIVQQAGDWVIFIAYYTGPEAPDLARQMVYQLRSKMNLPAYVYVHVDPTLKQKKEELEAAHAQALKLMNETGAIPTAIPKRTIRLEEQYAVLVGGWDKMEDASKYLSWLRQHEAPEIRSATGRTTREVQWEQVEDPSGKVTSKKLGKPINPFTTASVTRNPCLPPVREANKPDPFLIKLNENNEYSLLKCSRPFTLFVKEYLGSSEILSHTASSADKEKSGGSFLDKLNLLASRPPSALEASAAQAHETARVLRQLKFDAYVLHTRTSSIVAVGGFDGPEDPALTRTRQQLAQMHQQIVASRGTDPLELFTNPMVVEIPRP